MWDKKDRVKHKIYQKYLSYTDVQQDEHIMKTCPCNIQKNFLVVKMKIFAGKILIFFLFLLKT